MSWVMAAAGAWWAFASLTFAYAVETVVNRPGSLPGGTAAAWFDNWARVQGLTLFLLTIGTHARRAPGVAPLGAHPRSRRGDGFDRIGVTFTLTNDLIHGTPVTNPSVGKRAVGVILVPGAALDGGRPRSCPRRLRRPVPTLAGDARQQLRWVVAAFSASVCLAVAGGSAGEASPGRPPSRRGSLFSPGRHLGLGPAVPPLRPRSRREPCARCTRCSRRASSASTCWRSASSAPTFHAEATSCGLAFRDGGRRRLLPARARARPAGGEPTHLRRPRRPVPRHGGAVAQPCRLARPETVLPAAVETIGRTLALAYVAVALNEDRAPRWPPRTALRRRGARVPLAHHDIEVGELLLSRRRGDRLRDRDPPIDRRSGTSGRRSRTRRRRCRGSSRPHANAS